MTGISSEPLTQAELKMNEENLKSFPVSITGARCGDPLLGCTPCSHKALWVLLTESIPPYAKHVLPLLRSKDRERYLTHLQSIDFFRNLCVDSINDPHGILRDSMFFVILCSVYALHSRLLFIYQLLCGVVCRGRCWFVHKRASRYGCDRIWLWANSTSHR